MIINRCPYCSGKLIHGYKFEEFFSKTRVINLWRKTHTLACGMKATFHLINT